MGRRSSTLVARVALPAVAGVEVDPSGVVRTSSAEASADGRTLALASTGAGGPASEPCGADDTPHPVLGPDAATVVIAERDSLPGGACAGVGCPRSVEVVLPEPLGARPLLDLEGVPVSVVTAGA